MEAISPLDRVILAFVRWLWNRPRFYGRQFIVDRFLRFARAIPTAYGPAIRVRRHDYTNRAAIFGLYGDEIASWVRKLQPTDIFLDIGANTGIFSLIGDPLVPQGRIFAFEPNPDLFEDIRHNIRLNGATHIVPLNVALSDRTGTVELIHGPGHSGSASLRTCEIPDPSHAPRDDFGEAFVVLTVTPERLDIINRESQGRQICMKIDVEGHEVNVLRGLRDAGLLDKARWVIVEVDPNFLARFGATTGDLYDLMHSAGLRPVKGLSNADHYDEIFLRSDQPGWAALAASPTVDADGDAADRSPAPGPP